MLQQIIETLFIIVVISILFSICIWSNRMNKEFDNSYRLAREFTDACIIHIKNVKDLQYHSLFQKSLNGNESQDSLAKIIRENNIVDYRILDDHQSKHKNSFQCYLIDKNEKECYFFTWNSSGQFHNNKLL